MDYGKKAYLKAEELEKLFLTSANKKNTVKCFEVQNNNISETISSSFVYSFGEVSAEGDASPCFFINLNFSAQNSATINLTLYSGTSLLATLESKVNNYSGSVYFQSIASNSFSSSQELKLKIETTDSVVLSGLDLIGLNATIKEQASVDIEFKAAAIEDNLAISFVKDGKIYYALCSTSSPELNPQNFTELKAAISHDITFNSKKTGNPLTFAYIDTSQNLYISTLGVNGEILIDTSVSSAIVQNSDDVEEELVVVYVQNGSVFFKTIENGVVGQKHQITALPNAHFVKVHKFFSQSPTIYLVATDENDNNYCLNSLVEVSAKHLKEHLYCTLNFSMFGLTDAVADYVSTISSLNVDLVYNAVAITIVPRQTIEFTDITNLQFCLDMQCEAYVVPQDAVVYGVHFDLHGQYYNNHSLGAVYSGDCVGFTPATITIIGGTPNYNGGSWDNIWPYSQIKPCLKNGNSVTYLNPADLTQSADGTQTNLDIISGNSGDVFVEIPKIYYRFYKTDADVFEFEISNYARPKFCDYAYRYNGQTANKLYFAAYPTSIVGGVARSLSGQAKYITTNEDMPAQQAYINSRGTGFSMVNLNNSLLLQLLFVLQFKSLSYSKCIGYGFAATSESTRIYTGYSDAYPARTYGYQTSSNATIDRFLNIEGFASFANYTIEGSYITPKQVGVMQVDNPVNNWVNNSGAGYMFLKWNLPTNSRRGKKFVCNNYFGLMTIENETSSTSGGFDFFRVRATNLSANRYNMHFPCAGNNLVGVFSYLCMHLGFSHYGYGHRIVYYQL